MDKVKFLVDLMKLLMKHGFPIKIVQQGGRPNKNIKIEITVEDYKRNHCTDD